jgi:hypothetical protein
VSWALVSLVARTLRGATVTDPPAAVVRVGDAVLARLVQVEDGPAVLFTVADEAERDRLIAAEPATHFTTPRYAGLAAVLVRIDALDNGGDLCRSRLEHAWRAAGLGDMPYAPVQEPLFDGGLRQVATGSVYWLSLVDNHGHLRRNLYRFAGHSLLDWLARGWWSAARVGGAPEWPRRLRDDEWGLTFGEMFGYVFDRELAAIPGTPDEVLAIVRATLDEDAEPHFAHGDADDGDALTVSFWGFDDAFLARPDALDVLPHPSRGAPKAKPGRVRVDEYAELLRRLERTRQS